MRPLRNTEQVLNKANVARLLQIEREKGDILTMAYVNEQVAGVYPRSCSTARWTQEPGVAAWSPA